MDDPGDWSPLHPFQLPRSHFPLQKCLSFPPGSVYATGMRIQFSKMHGLGNDFVVIDAIHQPVDLSPDQVRLLAHRRFGVGCDQVLLVERPSDPAAADFRYRIFNADGNEVEQCGNGARCFAVFVRERGLTAKDHIPVETAAGIIHLQVQPDGQVTVDMGPPRLKPWQIPFEAARLGLPVKQVVGEALREWLQHRQRLSEADRQRRREALASADRLRQGQSLGVGSIEEDLETVRAERSGYGEDVRQ